MHPLHSIQICAAIAALTPLASAVCDAFDIARPSNRSWYVRGDPDISVQVSETLKCDADPQSRNRFPESGAVVNNCDQDQCLLPNDRNLYMRLNRTLSISVPGEVEEFIFDQAITTVNRELEESGHTSSTSGGNRPENLYENFDWVDFNETSVWATQDSGVAYMCLNQSQAAHWAFIPTMVCVNGTTSGCDGLDDDEVVEACGVAVALGSQYDQFGSRWGTLELVEVDFQATTEPLGDVYNATLRDGEEPRAVPMWAGGPNPYNPDTAAGTSIKPIGSAVILLALCASMALV